MFVTGEELVLHTIWYCFGLTFYFLAHRESFFLMFLQHEFHSFEFVSAIWLCLNTFYAPALIRTFSSNFSLKIEISSSTFYTFRRVGAQSVPQQQQFYILIEKNFVFFKWVNKTIILIIRTYWLELMEMVAVCQILYKRYKNRLDDLNDQRSMPIMYICKCGMNAYMGTIYRCSRHQVIYGIQWL